MLTNSVVAAFDDPPGVAMIDKSIAHCLVFISFRVVVAWIQSVRSPLTLFRNNLVRVVLMKLLSVFVCVVLTQGHLLPSMIFLTRITSVVKRMSRFISFIIAHHKLTLVSNHVILAVRSIRI